MFLEKLVHLRQPVVIVDDSARPTGAALLDGELLKGYLDAVLADDRDTFIGALSTSQETVPDALGLVDLRNQVNFTEFLSNGFAVRHFNRMDLDRFVITKRSADKDKIRREARYHGLLPEEVRHFFVQPRGYQEDEEGASYRMRRLYVPDVAVQWVHRAFSSADFDRFLDHLLHFLRARPVRDVGGAEAGAVARHVRRGPWLAGYVAAQLGFLTLLRIMAPRFFWVDDEQAQFVPTFHWFGHHLSGIRPPLMAPGLGAAGNFVADPQYGVYDPVHWLISWGVGRFDHLNLAAWLLGCLAVVVLGLGVGGSGRTGGQGDDDPGHERAADDDDGDGPHQHRVGREERGGGLPTGNVIVPVVGDRRVPSRVPLGPTAEPPGPPGTAR